MTFWFNKKGEDKLDIAAGAANIEVVAHKDARKEVVHKALQVNQDLRQLLEDNHFTIKIFLAAGGKTTKTKKVGIL